MALLKNLKKKVNIILRNYVDLTERDIRRREKLNEYKDIRHVREVNSPVLLGIIKDVHQYHKFFVKAALEMKISFDVIDIQSNDWWKSVNAFDYDGFLVWPNGVREALKSSYDSRIKLIVDYLHKPVFPNYLAIWLYENKIRGLDWLTVNGFPTIPTQVYYERQEALKHMDKFPLPVVIKTNLGASGKGVFIIKSRSQFERMINKSFGEGLKSTGMSPYAESRCYAYVQKFIPGMEEWRMVRIGDSYFGHMKMQDQHTGKHSGSLLKGWERPTDEMLDLLHEITERGGFRSMNVDMFRDHEGNIYVNELHAVFGQSTQHLMIIDGEPGRFIRSNNEWIFEKGNFVEGHSAKARITYFINEVIGKKSATA